MALVVLAVAAGSPVAVAQPAVDWTGFYAGGQVGGGWGKTAITDIDVYSFSDDCPPACTLRYRFSGAVGGAHAGWNWQAGNLVYSGEFDLSFSGMKKHLPTPFGPTYMGESFTTKLNWFGTARLRLGYAVDKTLLYATGGLAYGHIENRYDDPVDFTSAVAKGVKWGWTLGAGVEYAFAPNWALRAEYFYIDLGDRRAALINVNPERHYKWDNDFHVLRAGVSYRFGTR